MTAARPNLAEARPKVRAALDAYLDAQPKPVTVERTKQRAVE